MKLRCSSVVVCAATSLLVWTGNPTSARTQEITSATAANTAPQPGEKILLSSSAEDVLKLTKAKISDDVTLAFIQSRDHSYRLTAAEILYLRNAGVSDRLLTAMLTQPAASADASQPASAANETIPPAENSAPQFTNAPVAEAPVDTGSDAPIYITPAPTYYSFSDPWPFWYDPWPYWYPYFSVGFYWGWSGYRWHNHWPGGNYCHIGQPPRGSLRPPAPGGISPRPPASGSGNLGRTEIRRPGGPITASIPQASRPSPTSVWTSRATQEQSMRAAPSLNSAPSFRSSPARTLPSASAFSSRAASPTVTTIRSASPISARPMMTPGFGSSRSSFSPTMPAPNISRPSMPSSFGSAGGRSEFRGSSGLGGSGARPTSGSPGRSR